MNLLFASPTPWAWEAEKTFARLKHEMEIPGDLVKEANGDLEASAEHS